MASMSWSKVPAPMRPRWVLSLEKAIPMGLRSGPQAGRNRSQQPWALSLRAARAALSLLCVARLSGMTPDPGSSAGARTFPMDVSKAARCIAPEITQGATMPSHDSPAIRARNQGLIAPPPEWGVSPEAFTAQAAPVFAGHPGAGARFIGDDQPMGLFLHKLLPPAPAISCHIVPYRACRTSGVLRSSAIPRRSGLLI